MTNLIVVGLVGMIFVTVGAAALDRYRYTIADLL
jgi:hypothetical protein